MISSYLYETAFLAKSVPSRPTLTSKLFKLQPEISTGHMGLFDWQLSQQLNQHWIKGIDSYQHQYKCIGGRYSSMFMAINGV